MAFQLTPLHIPNLTTNYSAENQAFANLGQTLGNLIPDLQKQRLQQQKQQILGQIGKGDMDFDKAGRGLIALGDTSAGATLLTLGQKAKERDAESQFFKNFGLGGSPPSTAGVGPASLIQNESGGNWGATNDAVGAGGKVGHFGRGQFGEARLQDAANAGAIPQGTTPQQFVDSPELQKRAEAWHFGDIDNFIAANGFDKMVGQTINGVPITVDGMRAVAHLGGTGGLRKFIESGGRYNPADRNGTTLMAYLERHQGSSGPAPQRAQIANPVAMPQPVQVAETEADVQRLEQEQAARGQPVQVAQAPVQPGAPVADASNTPAPGAVEAQGFAIPGTDTVVPQSLMNDPQVQRFSRLMMVAPTERARAAVKGQLDLAIKDAERRQAQNAPTDVARNYALARRQGYQGSLLDYQKELRAQTNVNVKNEGQIPAGYRAVRDANGNLERVEPIPGSEAEQKVKAAAEKQQKAERLRAETGNSVGNALDDVDRLMKGSSDWLTTGALGGRLSGIPGTAAYDIAQALSTVKANISFDKLQQMRESSPTGGALGSVTEGEQKLLQDSYAALSQSQSATQFKTNLGRTRAIFERIVHGRTLTAQERKTGGPMTPDRAKGLREEAASAIAGGAPRDAVLKRLKEDYGITTDGL